MKITTQQRAKLQEVLNAPVVTCSKIHLYNPSGNQESGWIVLTTERIQEILGTRKKKHVNPVVFTVSCDAETKEKFDNLRGNKSRGEFLAELID